MVSRAAPENGTRPTGLTRSELLRRTGVAAAVLAVGGTTPPYAFAGPLRHARRSLKGELRILQWSHVTPAYDTWFDETWVQEWGEANDVEVTVDHQPYTRLPALVAAEAKAQKGHDLVGFLSPPAQYEDQLIDHGDVVAQIEQQVGPYGELGRLSTYNPRTRRYFGVSDSYVPAPAIWRHDLWESVGESPATWEHVRAAGPKLKALGHPLGLGLSSELDSNVALLGLLMCFGSFLQDASNRPALDNRRTVEAVQLMADVYAGGEERSVLSWSPASNNQYLLGGRGSLIVNAISAIRSAESLELPFADDLWLWPLPAGPHGRVGVPQYTNVYGIWRFAKSPELAERFVADLCANAHQITRESGLFSFPSFPNVVPVELLYEAAAADTHPPRGKYTILTTVATKHTRNLGYPGTTNAAVVEAIDRSLIPRMFAQVCLGRATAAESVRTTAAELRRIWRGARAAGRI